MEKTLRFLFSLCILFCTFVSLSFLTSCQDDDKDIQQEYGYVQFKLFKSASAPTAINKVARLEYLRDAHKIRVLMQHNGLALEQTLVLNAFNDANAEYGLRSDKLKLMAGDYTIVGFYLYDSLDEELLVGSVDGSDAQFSVLPNGMHVHNLSVDAVGHGTVNFVLTKSIDNSILKSAAVEGEGIEYLFSDIKAVDLVVMNQYSKEQIKLSKLPVTHNRIYTPIEGADPSTHVTHFISESISIDSVFTLRAGTYSIVRYITYADKAAKSVLGAQELVKDAVQFRVADNVQQKDVEVPVKVNTAAEHIKDYIALRAIWEALDGPHWKYTGEACAPGSNWNFEKDIDMWGDQPGVDLFPNGRVNMLSLIGFGVKGFVPDEIGQLTDLEVLYLGAHDEMIGGHIQQLFAKGTNKTDLHALRYDYHDQVLARDTRQFMSDPLQEAINADPKQQPIKSYARKYLYDVQGGRISNHVEGISKAIMRLTNLTQFYIANSTITSENFWQEIKSDSPFYAERSSLSWSNLKALTDLEIYNCPNLTSLPTDFIANLPEVQAANLALNTGISPAQIKADWETIADGPAGAKLQLLYLGYNNIEETPDYSHLSKMVKLGMLDLVHNKINKIHPFGKGVQLVSFYLDYNAIPELPLADDGFFFGYNDVETFSCSHNNLTKVPDIFNAKSVFTMKSVDFSFNDINGFEDPEGFHGINASTVNLGYNCLKSFPAPLFKSGSPIAYLIVSGNGMTDFPEGAMTGPKSMYLQSLEIQFNNLTSLPAKDFYSTNVPYLYGLDLSYNSFSSFPYAPLDCSGLTVLAVRHQRDAQGNRTLREWPTNISRCASLVALYLGGNDLRKIDDTISPFIRVFEIKDNPNISIDLSSVCSYIAAGYYTLFYDPTQDIRGCSYLDLENN